MELTTREAAPPQDARDPQGVDLDGGIVLEGVYADFHAELESLGLLADLEDELPADFTAIYEIGRTLDDPDSELSERLSAALELVDTGLAETTGTHEESESRIEVPVAEVYEAEFIRHWSDVRNIYSWQHLLPEEEFLRRFANRTLWYPQASAPVIQSIGGGDGDFDPSPMKQKVYVLLDTSTSMTLHHRFALAKSVVFAFLKRNRAELGEVFFRRFDLDLGPLRTARTLHEYDALLRHVARMDVLGNGTALERAVLQACEDIHEARFLAGTEILLVTDGAAHVDEGRLREALGDRIRLHCVRIGTSQVYASDAWVRQMLETTSGTSTRRDQRIVQLRNRRDRLREAVGNAKDATVRRSLQRGLAEVEGELGRIGEALRADYAHEIEHVADVFVEVPDLDASQMFRVGLERLEGLRSLLRFTFGELDDSPAPADALKRAAALLEHLKVLAQEQLDPLRKQEVEELETQLEQRLTEALEFHERHAIDSGMLTAGDQRDLRLLLHKSSGRYGSLWRLLIRYFYSRLTRLGARR